MRETKRHRERYLTLVIPSVSRQGSGVPSENNFSWNKLESVEKKVQGLSQNAPQIYCIGGDNSSSGIGGDGKEQVSYKHEQLVTQLTLVLSSVQRSQRADTQTHLVP